MDRFVAGVLREEGRIDCLVNNAGLGVFGPVDELDRRAVARGDRDQSLGLLLLPARGGARHEGAGEGWILNVASLAGKNPFAGGAAYNASKFGVIGLSEAAMLDLRQYGVRVAALLPGSVATDFSHPSGGKQDQSWKLQPADIAAMILHLLAYPPNALPSLVEMRPARPPK